MQEHYLQNGICSCSLFDNNELNVSILDFCADSLTGESCPDGCLVTRHMKLVKGEPVCVRSSMVLICMYVF